MEFIEVYFFLQPVRMRELSIMMKSWNYMLRIDKNRGPMDKIDAYVSAFVPLHTQFLIIVLPSAYT